MHAPWVHVREGGDKPWACRAVAVYGVSAPALCDTPGVLWETARAWPRLRAAWVIIFLIGSVAAALATAQRGSDWDALLAPEGVESVDAIRWLEEPGAGRWGLALAQVVPEPLHEQAAEGRRDILLFDGMLDADGTPYKVRRVGNLTRTPHADDRILDVQGTQLAVTAAWVEGMAVTVDVFNLRGDPQRLRDEQGAPRGAGDRFKIGVTNLQILGRSQGVGRSSYRLSEPVVALSGRVDEAHISLQAKGALASIQRVDGEVVDVHGRRLPVLRQAEELVLESWTQFTVNRFRAASWFGPRRIASLEKYVFDRVDGARITWFDFVGADNTALEEQVAAEPQAPMPEVVEPPRDAIAVGPAPKWPPATIDPPGPREWGFEPVRGEGVWQAWAPEWARHRQAGDRPWPVMRTSVRVAKRKPADHVTLVAMDLRQLELHLEAGTANPRSTTGLRGTGQVPRDPQTLSRLLLGFNGGFKTSHGAYGLMLQRRWFVPVKPAMATIGFFDDGSVRMGTWPGNAPLGSYKREHEWQIQVAKLRDAPQPPPDVVSLRQNLPPLVSGSQLNPGGARRWGGPVARLSHTSTPRSGVCIAPPDTLVYVWGKSTSASDIGEGMILAGCEYGMHLDMNPYHTGMSLYDVPLVGGKLPPEVKGEGPAGTRVDVASPLMAFDEHRYVAREVKDFFYLLRRRLLGDRIGPPPPGMPAWSSRGMPIALGLTPLGLISKSDDGVVVLAMDAAMNRGAAEVVGSVGVGFESLPSGPVALVRDGAWVESLPSGAGLVVQGTTKDGDWIVAGCDGCGLNRLMEVLGPVPVWHADVVGSQLTVDSRNDDGWKRVSSPPYPADEATRVVFSPNRVVSPAGTTDFIP